MLRRIGSVAVLVIAGLAWSAKGALVVPVSSTLHCWAQAEIGYLNLSAEGKPADVVGGSSYGTLSHWADAKVEGVYLGGWEPIPCVSNAYSTADLTISGDRVAMSGSGCYSHGGAFWEEGSIQSEVLLSFDLMQASEFNLTVAANPWAIGQATLRSGGQIVKVMGLAGVFRAEDIIFPPGCDFNEATGIVSYGQRITLDPGRYDVEFFLGLMPHAGTLGTGTAEFSMTAVPEPAAIEMVVMAGVGLLGIRRRW